ncbi:hypothetical protein CYY_002944 [Polysphondylium violaceum]|uniref:Uncharacterized protein n=1 Tax=Polysphondylium violaceum TaxID=133409 RepID=A0A8J4Q0G9_9MYCE|nr:hypothetical protein CYY_002944 [Polysphondylium violaceum]
MMKSLYSTNSRLVQSIRSYSTGTAAPSFQIHSSRSLSAKSTSFTTLGSNQAISFTTPVSNNTTITVSHNPVSKAFVPTAVTEKVLKHDLTEDQIKEIQTLRATMSQKQLAKKFNTHSNVISHISRAPQAVRDKLIAEYRLKPSVKVIDSPEVKQTRLELWLKKNQQREYDNKVIKSAESHERNIEWRRSKNEFNRRGNQETFDFLLNRQETGFQTSKVKVLTPEQKKAIEKQQQGIRRRKVVDDKVKQREVASKLKNRSVKNQRSK